MRVEYITICKYSTFFSVFKDSEDHRFDYFKNIDRQEDITDFIQIKLIDNSTYDKGNFSVYSDIVNCIHSYAIGEKVLFDTRSKVTLYNKNLGFEKVFKIISNSRFKYGLEVEITHHLFSKLSARVTNCNTKEEKFVNYYQRKRSKLSSKSRRKRMINITGEQAVNIAKFITSHPEVVTGSINYKLGEYSILFNLNPGDIETAERYLNILRRLGINAKVDPGKTFYGVIKPNIELYNEGYPFIRRNIENDRMTKRMLLEYYELKKVNRDIDYDRVAKIIGMKKSREEL